MINNKLSLLLAKNLKRISHVSKDTGISRTTLTALYYKKSKGITFETLDTLCRYFNCNVWDIFEYED